MKSPIPGRLILACLLCAIGAGTLPGCIIVTDGEWEGYSDQAKATETRTQSVPHIAGKPLEVMTENGDITVVSYGGPEVQITSRLRGRSQERLDQTEVIAQRDSAGVLSIKARWPEGKRGASEACTFEIKVPDVERLKLDSGNGDIDVKGLSGPAEIVTRNGDVDVVDHSGSVGADSNNGDITLVRVAAANADTSNGDIDVRLSEGGTGPVKAETSNGSITLTIGPSFVGTVNASSSNGTVKCKSGRGEVIGTASRTHGEWKFGEGPRGTLETSNGSITIIDGK